MEIVNKESRNLSVLSPPPPPPPPPKLDSTPNKTYVSDQVLDAPEEVTSALKRSTLDLKNAEQVVLSYYRQVKPIIQEGPQCGLVALNMACQLLSSDQFSIDTIFSTAKELKFTKFGEMFSAEDMGVLAETLLPCKKQILSDVVLHQRNILKHILEGWPVLVPYDDDKNHEPCCRKGHSAHWSIISGLCLIVSQSLCITEKLPLNGEIIHFSDGQVMLKFLDAAHDIYVYAHQGKSKHLAAWNFSSLLNSNINLVELSDKCKSDMVLPRSSDLCGLQNKAVLLSS